MTSVVDAARAVLPDAIELRRDLHRHPEVGLDLPRTQTAILDALNGLPLAVRTGEALSSVIATLDGESEGPTILLRADMDALPMPEETGLEYASQIDGVMHACGHDSHVAMLVGAARLLSESRAEICGRVTFMFQPGEEGHHGARVMLEEGLLEGARAPSAAFAIHQMPIWRSGVISTMAGPSQASGDRFDIMVRGKGGHAAAPHLAVDPIPAACEIVTAIQTVVARTVYAFDPAIVSITQISAGTTHNVIPETAQLAGTVRTVSERTRDKVLSTIQQVAQGVADAHGATAEVTIHTGYPVLVNDADMTAKALRVAELTLGEEMVRRSDGPPNMGSEDFAYVLQLIPGVMVALGSRPAEGPRTMNHSSKMVMDEQAMASGIAMHVAMALDYCSRV